MDPSQATNSLELTQDPSNAKPPQGGKGKCKSDKKKTRQKVTSRAPPRARQPRKAKSGGTCKSPNHLPHAFAHILPPLTSQTELQGPFPHGLEYLRPGWNTQLVLKYKS